MKGNAIQCFVESLNADFGKGHISKPFHTQRWINTCWLTTFSKLFQRDWFKKALLLCAGFCLLLHDTLNHLHLSDDDNYTTPKATRKMTFNKYRMFTSNKHDCVLISFLLVCTINKQSFLGCTLVTWCISRGFMGDWFGNGHIKASGIALLSLMAKASSVSGYILFVFLNDFLLTTDCCLKAAK